jgi:hypothetical protein
LAGVNLGESCLFNALSSQVALVGLQRRGSMVFDGLRSSGDSGGGGVMGRFLRCWENEVDGSACFDAVSAGCEACCDSASRPCGCGSGCPLVTRTGSES